MSEFEFWGELGNIFNAIVAYQHKTIEFNKKFVNPWLKLGNVFDQADNNADALVASRKAIEIDKENGENWLSLGDVYFKMGSFDDAADAYSTAISLNPNLGWAYANLALTNVTRQKYTQAVNLYVKSLELIDDDKDRAMIWNRLGNVYRKVNDYENAFIAFQMADECDGENTGFDDLLDEVTVEQKVMPIVAEVFVAEEKKASVDSKPAVVENEPVQHSESVAANDEPVDVVETELSDQESEVEIKSVAPMSEDDSPLAVDETVGDDSSEEAVATNEVAEAVEPESDVEQQYVATVEDEPTGELEALKDEQALEETVSEDVAEQVVEDVEVDTPVDEDQPAVITEEKVIEEWLSDDADNPSDETVAEEDQLDEKVADSEDGMQVEAELPTAQPDDTDDPSMEDDSRQPELIEEAIEENVVEPDASSDDKPVSEELDTEKLEDKDTDETQLEAIPEVQAVAEETNDEGAEEVSESPVEVTSEVEKEDASEEDTTEDAEVEVSADTSNEVADEEDEPELISDPGNEIVSENVVNEALEAEATDDLEDESTIGDVTETEEVADMNTPEEIETDVSSVETAEDEEGGEPIQETVQEVANDVEPIDDVPSDVPISGNDDTVSLDDAEDARLESASESAENEVVDNPDEDPSVEVQMDVELETDAPSMLDEIDEGQTDDVESSESDAGNPSLEADVTPVMSHEVETFADPSGENQPVVLAIEDLDELLQQTVADENVEATNNIEETEPQLSSENEAPENVTEPVMDDDVQVDVDAEKDDVAEVVAEITALADMKDEDVSAVDETDQILENEEMGTDADDNSAYEEFLKHAVEPVVGNDESNVSKSSYSVMNDLNAEPDTKNAHVWNELGNVYFNTGSYDEAVVAYSKAIELDDWFAWPYSNLALVYVQKEKYAEAILLYQRGIELFSSDTDKAVTWNRLGNVYRRLSDYDNAISCYQRADELDPNNATRSLRSRFSLLGNLNIEQSPSVAA